MRNARPRLPSLPAVVAGLAALLILLSPACKGSGAPEPTAGPSPTAAPTRPPPTATPVPPPEATDYRFLYSVFGKDEDVIWMVDPATPKKDRLEVARIPHEPNRAIKATLSPDGKKIAYTTMMPGGTFEAYQGDTYVLDLEEENEFERTKLVARFTDLRTAPRWDPDGQLLYLRQNIQNFVGVLLVDLREQPPPGPTATPAPADALPPASQVLYRHNSRALDYVTLGFDKEKPILYFVQTQGGTQSGSFLGRHEPATGQAVATATAVAGATATAVAATATAMAETATPVPTPTPTPGPPPRPTATPYPDIHGDVFLVLSDQIGHDYDLSPDATRVSFTVQSLSGADFVTELLVADIPRLEVKPLAVPEEVDAASKVRPLWRPDAKGIAFGRLPEGGRALGVAVAPLGGGDPETLAPPTTGYDEPLSWAPDGSYLVVSSHSGMSLANPGKRSLVFISSNGRRLEGAGNVRIEPVGWLAPKEEETEE
jgi:hypothetical protein